jgi:hypothetical protein
MSRPRIDSYQFGRIQIDGRVYTKDVIILPERVVPNWWRESGHSLVMADFEGVLEDLPPTLVVGKGASERMSVPRETRERLGERGITVLALPTDEACERYNEMREEAEVGAALHLTC